MTTARLMSLTVDIKSPKSPKSPQDLKSTSDDKSTSQLKAGAKEESKNVAPSQSVKIGFSVFNTIPIKEIEMGCEIGGGASSTVYKATWHNMTVAVKHLNFDLRHRFRTDQFLNEACLLPELQAIPGVVEYKGFSVDWAKNSFNMVMEYFPKGDLFGLVESYVKKSQSIPKPTCYRLIANVVALYVDLHAAGYVHADPKPENIMVLENEKVKLVDLGQAFKLKPGQSFKKVEVKGTASYVAPEIIIYGQCGFASDVFALGGVIYVLTHQATPLAYDDWTDKRIQKYIANGKRQSLSEDCPAAVKNVINKCWLQNPWDRPTARQLLEEVLKLPESCQPKGP